MESMIYLLKDFRFTESEAKVYVSLLENGPSSGYEISKLSGVARSKIYNVLEVLLRRGAITNSQGDKVTLYKAVPVAHLTKALRSKIEDSLNRLEQEGEKLNRVEGDEKIWYLHDWEMVKSYCEKMISNATEQVSMQIWTKELDPTLEECIIQKQKELDKVLVILYDEEEKYRTNIHKFYKHRFEKDKLEEMGGRWMLLTVDHREMVYVTFKKNDMTEAIYTKSHMMALFAQEYAYHDAYCLRLIDHLPQNVISEFGDDMEGIRDIYSL